MIKTNKMEILRATGLALLLSSCAASATTQQARCEYDKGTVLKLRFSPGGLPLVDGAINGSPITFLLDTGAAQTHLLPPKLQELKIYFSKPISRTSSGVGGKVGLSITRLQSLDFGPVHFEKPYLHVANNLNPKLLAHFDAILGMESLAVNDFEVDLTAGELKIHKGLCPAGRAVTWEEGAIELAMNPKRPETVPAQFSVHVQGRETTALLDTGAGRSFLDAKAALALGIEQDEGSKVRYAIGAGENRAPVWPALVKDIAIGTEKIKSAELMIGERSPDNEFLIGNDYIRNHRILFLPGQARILIKPVGTSAFSRKAQ